MRSPANSHDGERTVEFSQLAGCVVVEDSESQQMAWCGHAQQVMVGRHDSACPRGGSTLLNRTSPSAAR